MGSSLASSGSSVLPVTASSRNLVSPALTSLLAAQLEDCCVGQSNPSELIKDTEPPRGLVRAGLEEREVNTHRKMETPASSTPSVTLSSPQLVATCSTLDPDLVSVVTLCSRVAPQGGEHVSWIQSPRFGPYTVASCSPVKANIQESNGANTAPLVATPLLMTSAKQDSTPPVEGPVGKISGKTCRKNKVTSSLGSSVNAATDHRTGMCKPRNRKRVCKEKR